MDKTEIDKEELKSLKEKASKLEKFLDGLENHMGAYKEETGEFEDSDSDVCSIGEFTLNFFDAWR